MPGPLFISEWGQMYVNSCQKETELTSNLAQHLWYILPTLNHIYCSWSMLTPILCLHRRHQSLRAIFVHKKTTTTANVDSLHSRFDSLFPNADSHWIIGYFFSWPSILLSFNITSGCKLPARMNVQNACVKKKHVILSKWTVFGGKPLLGAVVWESKNRERTLWPRTDPKTHKRKAKWREVFPLFEQLNFFFILSQKNNPSYHFSAVLVISPVRSVSYTLWTKDSSNHGLGGWLR